MDNRTLILLFTCFVPLFTAVVGTIIEAISLQDSVTVRETHVKRMLMCYFLMFIFIGTGVATGVALPKIAIQILPFHMKNLEVLRLLQRIKKRLCYWKMENLYFPVQRF